MPASSSRRVPWSKAVRDRHSRVRRPAARPGASAFRSDSAWLSASTIGSSLPSITKSSWCSVSPMRWSVTRFCGKLYVRIFSLRSPVPTMLRRSAPSAACCFSSSIS